jgi:hypothetical protein
MSETVIETILLLNLSHIPLKEGTELKRLSESQEAFVSQYRFGFFVWVPESLDIELPKTVASLCWLARNQGCEFIRFDTEGAVIEELPLHDWDIEEC